MLIAKIVVNVMIVRFARRGIYGPHNLIYKVKVPRVRNLQSPSYIYTSFRRNSAKFPCSAIDRNTQELGKRNKWGYYCDL